jgi:hypothetical protein
MVQDPKIQELMQDNPQAPQIMQAGLAHINEHLGFEYRKQIELQLGFNLPPQTDENGEAVNMDPEVEARLAPLLAQAAQQLLQQNQGEMAQKQAQEQAQDPLVQMQMAELELKKAEQQRKAQKDQIDAQFKAEQLQVERQRIEAQTQLEREKLSVSNARVELEMNDSRDRENTQMVIDTLKHLSDQEHQKTIQRNQPKRSK